jgi:hypothetical protein
MSPAGFGPEHPLEPGADELDADDSFAGGLRLTYMHNASLSFKVCFFAPGRRACEWNPNFQAGTDGHVEASAKGSAAAAQIFAGSVFFEVEAFCILSPDV